jgi:hypothetical protein
MFNDWPIYPIILGTIATNDVSPKWKKVHNEVTMNTPIMTHSRMFGYFPYFVHKSSSFSFLLLAKLFKLP